MKGLYTSTKPFAASAVPVLGIAEKTDAGNLGASDCLLPLAVVLDG
jgi:hypothetical protein